MYNYDFKDFLYIVLTSIAKTIIYLILFFIIYEIIMFNHSLGISIADSMEIPYDMALAIISLGFVNNVTVFFTIFELIFIEYIFSKLNKNKIINRLFTDFCDFLAFNCLCFVRAIS